MIKSGILRSDLIKTFEMPMETVKTKECFIHFEFDYSKIRIRSDLKKIIV